MRAASAAVGRAPEFDPGDALAAGELSEEGGAGIAQPSGAADDDELDAEEDSELANDEESAGDELVEDDALAVAGESDGAFESGSVGAGVTSTRLGITVPLGVIG